MSPQRDFGYDVSNYCDINPEYGTLADFDEMIAKIHDLGMKLMIDIVQHTVRICIIGLKKAANRAIIQKRIGFKDQILTEPFRTIGYHSLVAKHGAGSHVSNTICTTFYQSG